MPAVLAVSSYPYRTSPVLRGAWILDRLPRHAAATTTAQCPRARKTGLRGAAPNPSANVSRSTAPTQSAPAATAASTRLVSRSKTSMPSAAGGTRMPASPSTIAANCSTEPIVQGPEELKKALLDRKDLFVRNLTNELLGYALGRGLTLQDSCTVDNIMSQLRDNDYQAETLIEAIVLSTPFRYQAAVPGATKGANQTVRISRRTLLRGAGVSLGLPWLEAMCPPPRALNRRRRRIPCAWPSSTCPTESTSTRGPRKASAATSPSRRPSTPLDLNDQILVLSNLWNANAKGGDGHYCKESAILTCATIKKTPGVDLANGTSMDQLAAQRLGEPDAASLPGTRNRPGRRRSRPGRWIHADLRLAYFLEQCHTPAGARTQSSGRLRAPLSGRLRPERHAAKTGHATRSTACSAMPGVCAPKWARRWRTAGRVPLRRCARIEQRVQRASKGEKRDWKARVQLKPEAAPTEHPANHEEHCKLMLDMIATAFQSDTTRISTSCSATRSATSASVS